MLPTRARKAGSRNGLRWLVGAILVAGVALSAAVGLTLRGARLSLIETELADSTRERALAIERELRIAVEHVESLAALYRAYDEIDQQHFAAFARATLAGHPTLQGLGFNPVVEHAARAAHERRMRAEGYSGYQITERDEEGRLVNAGERDHYVVVSYLEPLAGNEEALGYDVASEPTRRRAVERAAADGEVAVTRRLRLVQEQEGQFGALICAPVYRGADATGVGSGPGLASLRGLAVGIIRYGDVVAAALQDLRPAGVEMALYDAWDGIEEPLYEPSAGERPPALSSIEAEREPFTYRFGVGGRLYVVRGTPSATATGAVGPVPLGAFLTGLLLTLLVVAYVLRQATGRDRLLSAIQQVERAKQREASFGRMLDDAHDELYVFDSGTLRFVHANRGALHNTGYSMEEIRRLTPLDLKPLVDAGAFASLVEPLRDGTRNKVTFTTVHRRKDGSEYDVEVHLQLSTFEGAPVFVAMILDISERKQIEERLRQSQRIEALGTLAGGIAHDFNNVLTAIMGYAELSKPQAAGDPHLTKNLDEITRASGRARDMVRRILTFSRQRRMERRAMDLGEVVTEALQLMRASLPASVEIRRTLLPDTTIHGDPAQIHQVLMNLCTNAGHAMRNKGGVLEVAMDTVDVTLLDRLRYGELKPGAYARLRVSDSGYGIPPDIAEHVFEPFFTTKQSEGSGMGLAVTHGIVSAHEGAIRLSSQPGEGTTFEVLLPLAAANEKIEEIPECHAKGGSERILLVDDEDAIVRLLDEALTRAGYEVESFLDPTAALARVRELPDRFDLVISDYTMPKLGGIDLACGVREASPDLPVIIISGFGDSLDESTLREFGVSALMSKPPRIRDLKALIRSVLDQTGRSVARPVESP